MSIYSEKYKFIFIHIPKNGGSTFIINHLSTPEAHHFKKFEVLNRDLGYDRDPALGNHFTYTMIKDLCDKNSVDLDYDGLFKFCVIRNPWARMVSFYQHKMRKINKSTNGIPRNSEEDKKLLNKGFSAWLLNTQNPSDRVITKMPQLDWITDLNGKLVCDRIINIENYDKEMRHLSKDLALPKVLWKRYNSDKKRKTAEYKKFYDKKTISHIEKYFAKDIEKFNFKF